MKFDIFIMTKNSFNLFIFKKKNDTSFNLLYGHVSIKYHDVSVRIRYDLKVILACTTLEIILKKTLCFSKFSFLTKKIINMSFKNRMKSKFCGATSSFHMLNTNNLFIVTT
jgi:hypothetical protein